MGLPVEEERRLPPSADNGENNWFQGILMSVCCRDLERVGEKSKSCRIADLEDD